MLHHVRHTHPHTHTYTRTHTPPPKDRRPRACRSGQQDTRFACTRYENVLHVSSHRLVHCTQKEHTFTHQRQSSTSVCFRRVRLAQRVWLRVVQGRYGATGKNPSRTCPLVRRQHRWHVLHRSIMFYFLFSQPKTLSVNTLATHVRVRDHIISSQRV
jgi:hypothetical protein